MVFLMVFVKPIQLSWNFLLNFLIVMDIFAHNVNAIVFVKKKIC